MTHSKRKALKIASYIPFRLLLATGQIMDSGYLAPSAKNSEKRRNAFKTDE